jgi:hypothetical protein
MTGRNVFLRNSTQSLNQWRENKPNCGDPSSYNFTFLAYFPYFEKEIKGGF